MTSISVYRWECRECHGGKVACAAVVLAARGHTTYTTSTSRDDKHAFFKSDFRLVLNARDNRVRMLSPFSLARWVVQKSKGGRRKIILPPQLAFGKEGRPPFIPGGATVM